MITRRNYKFKSQAAREAFIWITNILQKNKISYQISGGLATQLYGATRQLADIDIDLPNQAIVEIFQEIQPYIIYGPTRYETRPWSIFLTTISYYGQEIDLGGTDDAYVFNTQTKKWTKYVVDFSEVKMMTIETIQVPVIDSMALIEYKSVLGREVDISDIKELAEIKYRIPPRV